MERAPDQSLAEADLVRDLRRGSEQAFVAIYYSHRTAVYRFAWRLAGSRSLAEDITQECFLALIGGAAFDGARGGLRTYLFGIVRNLVMRQFRISQREAEEQENVPAAVDLLREAIAAERSAYVAEAVARLPLLQREALVLFTFEELSLEEIGAVAGVDTGVIKARLHRARESLRKMLAPVVSRDWEGKFS